MIFHLSISANALKGEAVPFLILRGIAIKLKRIGKISKLAKFSMIKILFTKKVVWAGISVLPAQSKPNVSVPTAETFLFKRYWDDEISRPGQFLIYLSDFQHHI